MVVDLPAQIEAVECLGMAERLGQTADFDSEL
jgi:hypothetical protein